MNVKSLFCLLFICLVSGTVLKAQTKAEEVCYNPNQLKDSSKKSINSMAAGMIGKDSIKISYHSPGVRGRILWGGLVPFDEVWVTGAHNATNITIQKDFQLGEIKIPAGKYAIFTIPGKDEWTVIFNRNWEQHLANEYDEKDDVARIKVKPISNTHTERLQYFIENGENNKGLIAMQWEKIRIELPIRIL